MSNNGEYVDITNTSNYNINSNYITIANLNPFRYRGYYYDTETELYYLNTRYYDSELGRFINADSINNMNINSLNGINLYIYCSNNPIKFTDTEGSNWFTDLWNKTKSFFKRSWDIILGTAISIALVTGGLVIAVLSSGALANLGATMIGAGVGGFINGLQSKIDGDSYWGGYVGGFVSGGLTGLGGFFGSIGVFIGGFMGNFAGTIISDVINGHFINNEYYWQNITIENLLSGLVALGSFSFGNASNILKKVGFKDLYVSITVLSEFIFSSLYDNIKTFIHDLFNHIQVKYGL